MRNVNRKFKYPHSRNPLIPNNKMQQSSDQQTAYPGSVQDQSEIEWDRIYPLDRDARDFWAIVRKYVEGFVHIEYETKMSVIMSNKEVAHFLDAVCNQMGIATVQTIDDFINLVTQLICSATCYHEQVGQISEYMLNPTFIGTKLCGPSAQGDPVQTLQTYTQILVLATVTGRKMPGITQDFSHILPLGDGHLQNYQQFRKGLHDLVGAIDARNKYFRDWPLLSFNPRNIELSVSV